MLSYLQISRYLVTGAINKPSPSFTVPAVPEKAPTRTLSLLVAPTSARTSRRSVRLYWLQCRSRRTIECSQGGVLSFSPECGQWSRSY